MSKEQMELKEKTHHDRDIRIDVNDLKTTQGSPVNDNDSNDTTVTLTQQRDHQVHSVKPYRPRSLLSRIWDRITNFRFYDTKQDILTRIAKENLYEEVTITREQRVLLARTDPQALILLEQLNKRLIAVQETEKSYEIAALETKIQSEVIWSYWFWQI